MEDLMRADDVLILDDNDSVDDEDAVISLEDAVKRHWAIGIYQSFGDIEMLWGYTKAKLRRMCTFSSLI
jgi:hypothetical protein